MNIIITVFNDETKVYNFDHAGKEALKVLPEEINGYKIIGLELPMMFKKSFGVLKPYLNNSAFAVFSLGFAGGDSFALERVALNLMNTNGTDHEGYRPIDETIVLGGKNAYFSTLPLRKIEKALNDKNIKTSLSNSAGLSLCNNIMYQTRHFIEENNLNIMSGFFHLPHMIHPSRKDESAVDLSVIVEGIKTMIKSVIEDSNS